MKCFNKYVITSYFYAEYGYANITVAPGAHFKNTLYIKKVFWTIATIATIATTTVHFNYQKSNTHDYIIYQSNYTTVFRLFIYRRMIHYIHRFNLKPVAVAVKKQIPDKK